MLKNYKLWIASLVGLSLIVSLPGCSNRGVASGNDSTSVNMSLKIASPGMVDAINQFRVIVTADDIDPAIEVRLELDGRYLHGEVMVPPGEGRTFTVEASDVDGAVLYRGDTTLNVSSAEIVELTIDLFPVISLVRISPRYLEVPANSDFFVDVRAFNVSELYGISFRLHWQGSVIYPDSARSLLPLGRDQLWLEFIDTNQQFYEIGISSFDQINPIVDANGDADLVRIFFSAFSPEPLAFSASLLMEVTQMTKLPDNIIPLDSVKVDGSVVVVEFPVL